MPIAELLGMTLADVQLLVAHARNEADHPSFKVSAIQSLLGSMLNDVSGIFSTVSSDVRLRNLAHPVLPKVCLYRPEATQLEMIFKGRFGVALLGEIACLSE